MTPNIILYLLGMNLFVFLLYGWDKFCAKRRWRRVPEATLHLFTLAGGSAGALAGQLAFRHKTRKGTFQLWFRLTLALHSLILILLAVYHL